MTNPMLQDTELLKPRLGTSGKRCKVTKEEKSCKDPFRDWISTTVGIGIKTKRYWAFCEIHMSWLVIICCPRVNINDDRKQNLSAESSRGRERPVSLRQDSCEEDRHVRWDAASIEQSRWAHRSCCVHVLSPWSQKVINFLVLDFKTFRGDQTCSQLHQMCRDTYESTTSSQVNFLFPMHYT